MRRLPALPGPEGAGSARGVRAGRAGMRQVAREAGVSPTTVSNVLDDPEPVAEEPGQERHERPAQPDVYLR
jgi:hypothetical protein